jgi:hypothetical protein
MGHLVLHASIAAQRMPCRATRFLEVLQLKGRGWPRQAGVEQDGNAHQRIKLDDLPCDSTFDLQRGFA